MAEVIVPFTFTATQINAFDATGSGVKNVGGEIITLASNSRAVWVPTRLELVRRAGTAYSLTTALAGSQSRAQHGIDINNAASSQGKGAFLEVYSSNSASFDTVWFRVPARGFLDSALEEVRLALPLVNGAVMGTNSNTWKIRSTVPIASGTGSLIGRLYFTEHFITS